MYLNWPGLINGKKKVIKMTFNVYLTVYQICFFPNNLWTIFVIWDMYHYSVLLKYLGTYKYLFWTDLNKKRIF